MKQLGNSWYHTNKAVIGAVRLHTPQSSIDPIALQGAAAPTRSHAECVSPRVPLCSRGCAPAGPDATLAVQKAGRVGAGASHNPSITFVSQAVCLNGTRYRLDFDQKLKM